jgi:uncharacterized membrane protein (UPF0127 family)
VSGPAAPRFHFLAAVLTREDPFALRLADSQVLVADSVRAAVDSAARRRGLLGQAGLRANEALVVAPTQGIHTFGMRFAIDVAFVDREGLVLKIAADVPPRRVRVAWRAFAAVELAAGRCAAVGLGPGSRLVAGRETP